MEKTFNPQAIETSWYQLWEDKGYFSPRTDGDENYCIMIPPPNVTGSLHMGHAFQDTIMDGLIRYNRMKGKNTLWQVGTDHAGIATQMVVERKLAEEGNQTRHDLGREKFLEKVWEWKEHSGGTITGQLRRMASSVDWSRERFTMDDGFYHAVQQVFIQLYDEDLIYRGKRLVNWDPKLHTAISDLEVISEDEKGFLWHLRYPLADGATTSDGQNYLVVATTRPETMLGDTAVAINPNDARYQELLGKFVELPFTGRRIPIIADDYVDMEFGTGCVKITPAHDFNDYEMGKRHALTLINIMDREANIRDIAEVFDIKGQVSDFYDGTMPDGFAGLSREDARKKVVADLDALGLLEKIDDHGLKVPRGDRSGVIVEPFLTDQWFVRTEPLAKPAIEAVENGDIKFVPQQYENMYFAWMRDIQDWCISRQLWWGHRIPAWYDEQGKIYVGQNEETVRVKYQLDDSTKLKQDDDVLDTWFSSALWTFGTLGWPEETPELKAFHPTDVLVTGFDIIFFWVARMIMMTLKFKKEVPFKTVYVHGLVRDQDGQKMSKSKGNVLDPLDLIDGIELETLVDKRTSNMMQQSKAEAIEKSTRKHFPEGIAAYGTDALRFTFCSLASTGRDIKFDMGRIEGYRNFCNKIWNATSYVLMNAQDQQCDQNNNANYELSIVDKWIISRLQATEKNVVHALDEFRFDHAAQQIYDFFWNEYCSWYIELSKPVLWDENASEALKTGTRRTLVRVLESALRLTHPIMPFITEELWQKVKTLAGASGETIMLAPYPEVDPSKTDPEAEAEVEWLKGVIVGIRNIRGEMNISPGKALPILIQNGSSSDKTKLTSNEQFLKKLAKLDSITWLEETDEAPQSATALVGEMKVLVPMAGLIDVEAELARLDKEIGKAEQDVKRVQGKLNNPKFVDNAPEAVVNKEKQKAEDAQKSLNALLEQKRKIETL